MARRITRFPVGRKRIGRSVSPLEAGYTRSIRAQMEQIEKAISARLHVLENLTPAALRYGLLPIFEESQRLVPVLSGALKDSGYIETRKGPRGAQGEVGYGKGGDPFYAVIVHERMELHHDGVTQAKYLEEAVSRHGGKVPDRVAEFLRERLGL